MEECRSTSASSLTLAADASSSNYGSVLSSAKHLGRLRAGRAGKKTKQNSVGEEIAIGTAEANKGMTRKVVFLSDLEDDEDGEKKLTQSAAQGQSKSSVGFSPDGTHKPRPQPGL